MARTAGWIGFLLMLGSAAGAAELAPVPAAVSEASSGSATLDAPPAGEEPLLEINHWPAHCRSVRLRRDKSGCLNVRWRPEGCQLKSD